MTHSRSTPRRRVLLLAAALVGCGTGDVRFSGGRTPTGPGPDSTSGFVLTVSPNPVKITIGAKAQFSAQLRDALGNLVAGTAVWGSANIGVATVDSTGVVTGQAPGTTTISAAEHGLQTTASLEVDPVPVATVIVTPSRDTLQVGTQVSLSALTKDVSGNILTGRLVGWSSNATLVASVSATGVVTAVGTGTAVVSATSEGVTGTSTIVVINVPVVSVSVTPTPDTIPLGGFLQLTATPRDSVGNPLSGRPIAWSSVNTGVATVTSAGGVTGAGVGTTQINATSGAGSGVATVTVVPVPVASVSVTPKPASVQTQKTVQLAAATRDAKGNLLTGRVVTWSSATPGVATVDGNGLVTGVTAGSSLVTATSEGVNGSSTVNVTVPPPTLVRVILTPDTATVTTGGPVQFSTSAKMSDSSTTAVTPTYTATGGTISASGLYTAGQTAGTFKAVATSQGLADTSILTVVRPSVATVLVSPTLDTVTTGLSVQLAVTTKDSVGHVLTGRVVTWSSNGAAATVSGTGLVTGVSAGSVTITATSEGKTGTSNIVVVIPTVASVTVSPTSGTIAVGQTLPLTATARDSKGNVLPGQTFTWRSTAPSAGTVDISGVVTGVGVGSTTVVASAGGDSATSVITVAAASLWPNEPPGFTKVTEHYFNTITNSDGAGTATWTDDQGMTIGADATAPRSPPNVGLFDYPAGFAGGSASGAIEYDHIPAYSQVYISFWMKLSPNFQGHSTSTNKVLFLWIDNGSNNNPQPTVFLSNEGAGSNPMYPTMRYQGSQDSREYFYQNQGNDQAMTRGVWHRWEVLVIANTPGQSNGVYRWWIDGIKVGDYTNIDIVGSAGSPDFRYIYLEPIWGGGGGTVTNDMTLEVDHLYLSGRP